MNSYYMIGPDGKFSVAKDDYGQHIIFDKGIVDSFETVYSDRLLQWDRKKHDLLLMKHFGDIGQYWSIREPGTIEKFLSDYLGYPIELAKILQGENQSSGYPYWCFFYRKV